MPIKRNATTLGELLADAVPVKGITWGRVAHPSGADDARGIPRHHPIAVLDLAQHPDISITDLSRVYRTDMPEGEGPVEFAWDFWPEPGNERCRLILAYSTPVAVEFSIVFSCAEHWNLLRWIVENDGMVVLADEGTESRVEESDETPSSMLVVQMGGAEELAMFLCGIKIAEAHARKGKPLSGFEVVMKAFEGKRFLSFTELSTLLSFWLHIPYEGKEALLLYTFDTHKRVPLDGISPQLKQVFQQMSKHPQIRVDMVKKAPHLIRHDWIQEREESDEATAKRRFETLPHVLPEEFTAGAIPVLGILEQPHRAQSESALSARSYPVARLDLSKHPKINLQGLARQGAFLPDAKTTFEWTLAERAKDILVRLTCTCPMPVSVQFAILFSYRQHQTFLRWVMEHDDDVPVADAHWKEQPGTENAVVLHARNEDLPMSLSIMLMHQILTREERVPDVKEMAQLLFAVKRYRSLNELADFAREALRMPVQGTEEQMIANATEGPNAALIAQQLSREFRIFLLQILTLEGVTSGMYKGEAHLFTEDWLANQQP